MAIERNTNLGNINISMEVISSIAGGAATECYGVVGMASQKVLKDGFFELLKMENFSKGIVAREEDGDLEIDMYIIVGYGLKISEVVLEVQKKVKYILEQTLDVHVTKVNVYVQGIRVIG